MVTIYDENVKNHSIQNKAISIIIDIHILKIRTFA